MDSSIDLERLQVLRMLAHRGTITAAADALHLTPSAASHRVRQLSRELGADLIEPDGRRVRLTSAGELLVAHADTLQAQWEQARADLRAHADGQAGVLRVAGFPTAIAGLVAPAVEALRADRPGITVRIVEAESDPSFDMLLAHQVDIAVVVPSRDAPPLDSPCIEQEPLFKEPLDLLVPAGHAFAGRDNVTLAEASCEQWIVPAAGRDFHQLTLTACASAGFTPRVIHQVRDHGAIAALVGARLGVALVPRLADLGIHPASLCVPLTGEATPSRRILAAIRRGSADDPTVACGLDALRNAARARSSAATVT